MPADPRLIVPLDLPTRGEAEAMVEALGDAVSFYKIGLQLLAGGGMDLARRLKAGGFSIFLDWKLHDIGATVEKAAAAIVESGACDFLTVHAEPQVLIMTLQKWASQWTSRRWSPAGSARSSTPAQMALSRVPMKLHSPDDSVAPIFW